MTHHVMLDLNYSTIYEHKMVKYWPKTITQYHEVSTPARQHPQLSLPVTDKSPAVFQMRVDSEGCFTSIPAIFICFTD